MKTQDSDEAIRQTKPLRRWKRQAEREMSNQEAFDCLQPGMPRRMQLKVLVDHLGITVKDLADVGDVSEQTIRNWKTSNGNFSPEGIDDVRAISEIMVGAQTLSLDQIGAWFRSRNRGLDHRTPLDAIQQNDFSEVVTAAEQYVAFVPDLSLVEEAGESASANEPEPEMQPY